MAAAASPPDVTLVRPRNPDAVPDGAPVQDPLGVGYLAARLRQSGRRVAVVDGHALDLGDEGIGRCVLALGSPVVGLSLHSFADYRHCLAISEHLARAPGRPYCVWGGEHATFHAARILRQHASVDAVVLGEGEETFRELVDRVLGGEAPGAVAGAVTRDASGEPLHGGDRPSVVDLDELPSPDKDVVEAALCAGKRVSISLLTGRGCTHGCAFCTAHDFMRLGGGPVWRRRSPARVADEVEALGRRYLGHPLVHPVLQFQDVIFLGASSEARRWTEELLDELERRRLRIPFYCMARADALLANERLLPRLVERGLWSVEVGIESGVDRILALYDKGETRREVEEAVELLRRLGITYDASGFIMFDPRMTLDELEQNASYLLDHGAATWDFFVTRLQLYPGTRVREEMIARGLFDGADDVGRTSGYRFLDPRVGAVAAHARSYTPRLRALDLLVRDAKAALAMAQRRGAGAGGRVLERAVDLVQGAYHAHFTALVAHARSGDLEHHVDALVAAFLERVDALAALLQDLLAAARAGRLVAQRPEPPPVAA